MLYTLIVIVHVFICFLMIGAILLQSGKGAEIGAAFGGSSQTVFGSRGPANFLSKLTVIVAAVFMVTSLQSCHFSQATKLLFDRHRYAAQERAHGSPRCSFCSAFRGFASLGRGSPAGH